MRADRRDSETGRIGTVITPFTVPNLNREELRAPTRSVVLSSQRVPLGDALYSVRQKVASDAANPQVHDGEKLIPRVTRVFSRSRDLHVFLQTYQRTATATQPLVAFVGFYRGGVKVFETQPLAVTDGLDPRSKAVPLRFTLPLAKLEPGRYDCQVSVLDPTGSKAAFWRAPSQSFNNGDWPVEWRARRSALRGQTVAARPARLASQRSFRRYFPARGSPVSCRRSSPAFRCACSR